MEDRTAIVLMAIACLTALECFALYLGINGTLFTLIVAAIAGLAGFELRPGIKGVLDVLKGKTEPSSDE